MRRNVKEFEKLKRKMNLNKIKKITFLTYEIAHSLHQRWLTSARYFSAAVNCRFHF